jgi:alpha-N-arabinofuranosidase
MNASMRLGAQSSVDVSPYVFGGFLEHFATALYGGVCERDTGRLRADVLGAVRAMGPTMVRYPGGCFSDWYHWRDGVGEASGRPRYERQFWTDLKVPGMELPRELTDRFGPPEPNTFGTDEFLRYCLDLDAEPLLNANCGTGTAQEAADWLDYTNRRDGSARPVRWWGIGNELYGGWEAGHCTAPEYAGRYLAFSETMRKVDPDIRLMPVGVLAPNEPEWNDTVIRLAGSEIDILSLHYYFPGAGLGRDLADDEMETRQLLAGARHLGAGLDRTLKQIDLLRPGLPVALDEWNLWSAWPDLLHRNHRRCDSIFFAGCFNRMIERADRVRMAMISHLVNTMAPIQTTDEAMHVTASYLTFLLYRRYVRKYLMPMRADSPQLDVVPFGGEDDRPQQLGGEFSGRRTVPALDAAATSDSTGVTIFAANGLVSEPLRTVVRGLPPAAVGRMRGIDAPGPYARNEFDAPNTLRYAERLCATDADGECVVELPPATVTAIIVDAPARKVTSGHGSEAEPR